jgi:putative zinc finger protein
MDHRTIDAENVAERYVTGRLPPEEAARFEEHYLDCPACCARVEAAERMERGLRRLAEEAAGGSGRRFARAGRSPAWGLAAAAVLVLALLPAGFERRRAALLERDLAAAQGELARARTTAPAPDAHAAALAGELAEARRELAQETARREELARPQADLPLLRLAPLRGGGEEPVRTLTLPRKPGWIALWIEPGGDEAPAYRATLADAHGNAVLAVPRLALNDLGALLLTVHSSTLAPGRYRLEVDALGAGAATGGQRPAARFAIQVAAPR